MFTDNPDMDISPSGGGGGGDSTPTSETSYSHSSTPSANYAQLQQSQHTSHSNNNVSNNNDGGAIHVASSALPRLSSNPATPTGTNSNSQSSSGYNNHILHSNNKITPQNSQSDSLSPQGNGQGDVMLTSNTPGPPSALLLLQQQNNASPPVTMAGLPKILSQITGNKQLEQNDLNPQKALQTINNALARQHSASSSLGNNNITTGIIGISTNSNLIHESRYLKAFKDQLSTIITTTIFFSFRERVLNSPLYTSPHYNQCVNLSQANIRGQDNTQTIVGGDGPPTPTQELDQGMEQRRREFFFYLKKN